MFRFSEIQQHGEYEELIQIYNKSINLKGFICINNTLFGPAIGGVRILDYSNEEAALSDVTRLALAMTKKSIYCGGRFGGAKTVLMMSQSQLQQLKTDLAYREIFFRGFGRHISGLGGRYYVAEDINTTVDDMDIIKLETNFVLGTSFGVGNPARYTAQSVFYGIMAAVEDVYHQSDFKNLSFAIQGVGNVGFELGKLIYNNQGKLYISDLDESLANVKYLVNNCNASFVSSEKILQVRCDVLCPCALGGVIKADNIDTLDCKIIAGSANNMLQDEVNDSKLLHEKNILFIPDYVINAGGLIAVGSELNNNLKQNNQDEYILNHIKNIYQKVKFLISQSQTHNMPLSYVAENVIKSKTKLYSKVNDIYVNNI